MGSVLLDPDQPRIDRPRDILQRALEEQVGAGVAYAVVLQRVEVEELLARREVDGLELGVRAFARKRSLDTRLGEFAAQRDVEQAQRRVLLQLGALVGEMPDVATPFLDRDVADLRSLAEEDLGRAAAVAGLGVILRDVFVEIVEA